MAKTTVTFGDLLRRMRKSAGLTQEELAERAGLSRRGINDLERGARHTPRRETLALLIEALEPTEEQRAELLAAARRGRVPAAPITGPPPPSGSQRQAQGVADGSGGDGVAAQMPQVSSESPGLDPGPPDATARHSTDARHMAAREERKLVTVLIADVTGSTALGETLDPEDLRALMGRYSQHARHTIAAHGGTLEQFIGDAVMAVFGLPTAHGNDAERALAAALALREAVAGDPMLAERLVLRIGVNTGEVVATPDVSGGDFLVTGDPVNMAARLQQAANPGEALVGSRTHVAADAAFAFGEARSVEVQGKRQPMRVFSLLGSLPVRRISRPPLVGRRQDLAQLALLRDRALEERRPQLVSIVAPAGTGKSRLLEDFLAGLDPAQTWQVATARCVPYGQTLTYWPLRGLLDDLLDGAATLERVTTAFAAAGYAHADADRLARLVLVTLGLAPEEATEREGIFHAWRLLIEALARQAPRIVVFEDLHWASDSLLDLVEHVLRPRTEAALLVVATGRPELLDRRPAWGGGRDNLTSLALAPLSGAQTAELVARLAAGVPAGVPAATRRQIVERSGGNPFFAIELVHAATRHGDGSGPLAGALPDTVHEAVLARLDLLAPSEREALQVAAVVGRTFHLATLHALLTTRDPAAVEAAFDGLLARDLIVPVDGGATYSFRHILFRDVAYGTLSRAERVRLHTAVAEWLEAFAAGRMDEFVELIAYHFHEAAQLARLSAVPQGVPVDTARAVQFLERAGTLASQFGAFSEARSHLESAITLAPAVEHLRLNEALGDCLAPGDNALAAYRRALDAWRVDTEHPPLVGARLLRKLLVIVLRWHTCLSERVSREDMIALYSEAWQLAEKAGAEYELWRLRAAMLWWSFWNSEIPLDDAPAQMALGLEAAAYFEAQGDWDAFSMALDAYAVRARDIGDFAAAAAASVRRLAAPNLSAVERCDALAMLVEAQTESADYAAALLTVRAAIARRRSGEPATLLGYAAGIASLAAYLGGRWSEVTDLAAVVDETWEEWQGDPGFNFLPAGYVALFCVALAREDRTVSERAEPAIRLVTARHLPAWRALLDAHLNDDIAPLHAAAQSIANLAGVFPDFWLVVLPGMWLVVLMTMFLSERGLLLPQTLLDLLAAHPLTRCHVALRCCTGVALALAEGNNARLAQAIDETEAQGLIPHAARMRIVLAERTGDRTYLAHARPVLEKLGDRQFLRRLDAVAATLG